MFATLFQYVGKAHHITADVGSRILNRITHTRLSTQMTNRHKVVFSEQSRQIGRIFRSSLTKQNPVSFSLFTGLLYKDAFLRSIPKSLNGHI